MSLLSIWPASREKGPSDITNSVDQDQPLHDVEIAIRNLLLTQQEINEPLM